MSNLRDMIDGRSINAANGKQQIFDHVKKAAATKADYDVAKMKLATKLAPMQQLVQLSQQMHGPNPQDPNDPFQNPYMQEGMGGPGGVGQGMNNQDDLARTGQMTKPAPGGVDNYLAKQTKGIPGQPNGDGNNIISRPGSPKPRSTSGSKPPGKQTQPTNGKPAATKKGKSIKLEISDDKMAAEAIKNGMKRCKTCKNFFNPAHPKAGKSHCPACKSGSLAAVGTSEGAKKAWDTRGRGQKESDPRMDQFDRSQRGHQQELSDARQVKKGVPQGEKIDWRKYGVNPDLPDSENADQKKGSDPRMDRFDREQRGHDREVKDVKDSKRGGAPGLKVDPSKSKSWANPRSAALNDKIDWSKYGFNPDLPDYMNARKSKFSMTTKRGKPVPTTGDYHDKLVKSAPSVGVGLAANKKKGIMKRPNIGPFPSSLVAR